MKLANYRDHLFPQVSMYPPDEVLNYSVINQYINRHLDQK